MCTESWRLAASGLVLKISTIFLQNSPAKTVPGYVTRHTGARSGFTFCISAKAPHMTYMSNVQAVRKQQKEAEKLCKGWSGDDATAWTNQSRRSELYASGAKIGAKWKYTNKGHCNLP